MNQKLIHTDPVTKVTTKLVFHYRNYSAATNEQSDKVAVKMAQAVIFKEPKSFEEANAFDYNWRCAGASLWQAPPNGTYAPLVGPGVSVCSPEDRYVKAVGRAIATQRLRNRLAIAYRQQYITQAQLEVGLQLISNWA